MKIGNASLENLTIASKPKKIRTPIPTTNIKMIKLVGLKGSSYTLRTSVNSLKKIQDSAINHKERRPEKIDPNDLPHTTSNISIRFLPGYLLKSRYTNVKPTIAVNAEISVTYHAAVPVNFINKAGLVKYIFVIITIVIKLIASRIPNFS